MKRSSVLLGIIIIAVVIITSGCMFYTALKPDAFKNHFIAIGYTIEESATNDYGANTYLIATKEDVPFKVEYYSFDEVVDSKKAFEKLKSSMAKYMKSSFDNLDTTGAEFSKTKATSSKEYVVISRVKNTVICVFGTKEFKYEIDNIFDNINY